jgi:Tfp pilus assembly protein PilZ
MPPRDSQPQRDRGSFLPSPWLHGAGKWVTAGITTIAAILAVLVNAQNLGLGAWLGSHGIGFADYAASRITVYPRSDSLFAVGDTVMLAATVTDRRGSALVGASVQWLTDDSAVATVDSAGTVIARGRGAARITARVRELIAGARIAVRPRVVRVAISGDEAVRVPEGEQVQVIANALDARGFRVRDRAPTWTSADSSIGVVDAEGKVTGRAPGRTTLTATADGYSARAVLEVVMAPAAIVVEAGDAQRIPVGHKLPQPVVVRVVSKSGRPIASLAVAFRPEDADGSANPATAITDKAGRARTTWTLSGRPGRQRLAASVEGLDSAGVVSVEADPVPRNTRVQVSGQPPAGPVGQPLEQPVSIRATDSLGTALADVPVVWTALDNGRAEALADRTDSLGEARARWTLGPKAGEQRVRVQLGNPRTLPPAVVKASAAPGAPHALRVVSGDGQHGGAGRPLAKDIIVLATDLFGNPVSGAEITPRPSDGSLADSIVTSDEMGRAGVRWTLGRKVGQQRLQLRLSGGDSVVHVTARADPLPPANIAFQAPPGSGTPGRAAPVTVAVTDAYGNPVADVMVVFRTSSGALSTARVMSDAKGRAATRWTPAQGTADPVITAAVRGTTVKASHTVHLATTARPRK